MEVPNITNMPNPGLLPVGTICNLIDKVDVTRGTVCTIRFVEPDDEITGLYYYYLVANNDELNIQYDPRFGKYFDIVNHDNMYLVAISEPTLY